MNLQDLKTKIAALDHLVMGVSDLTPREWEAKWNELHDLIQKQDEIMGVKKLQARRVAQQVMDERKIPVIITKTIVSRTGKIALVEVETRSTGYKRVIRVALESNAQPRVIAMPCSMSASNDEERENRQNMLNKWAQA